MAMTLITTNTSSGAAASAFTSSIDSTYKLYIFKFYDVNPATNNTHFTFNGSIDSGSNYNVTKTTTYFDAYHQEDDSSTELAYREDYDHAQATGYQYLAANVGGESDESYAGELHLFNPSSTTYVKHFYVTGSNHNSSNAEYNIYVSGYFNTTSAIDAIDFKMASGDMDAVIKMYGVG